METERAVPRFDLLYILWGWFETDLLKRLTAQRKDWNKLSSECLYNGKLVELQEVISAKWGQKGWCIFI